MVSEKIGQLSMLYIELTDKISKAIDEGKFTVGIFLDLSKDFDTVFKKNLNIMVAIRGNCLKWFENYFIQKKANC